MTEEYDIIVVGAGLSGLSAAYHIRKKCNDTLSILVLEAKSRVGGRTQTVELRCSKSDPSKKALWDAGGQWVTDPQKHVTALIKEFGLHTYKQHDTGKKILEVENKIKVYNSTIPRISIFSLIDMHRIISKFNREASRVNTLDPYASVRNAHELDTQNLEQLLFSNSFTETARQITRSAIRVIFGLELSQINALFGLMYVKSGGTVEALSFSEKDCAQEKRVKNGTQQISEKLLERVLQSERGNAIKYDSAVVEVDQQDVEDDGVILVKTINTQTQEETVYKARRKVISSMPLNQYAHVRFRPELPLHKREVFNSCKMGNFIKFIVTYERPFWREKGFSGEVCSDGSIIYHKELQNLSMGPIAIIFDNCDAENRASLLGFIAARAAVEWLDHSADTRKEEVLQALVRYFGEEATDYIDYYEKVWSHEPYSGGCPTLNVMTGDAMCDYSRATREPFYNVHFCGTESATEWQGYMDGAVESGERAANEALFSIGQCAKTGEEVKLSNVEYEKTYYYHKELCEKMPKLRSNRRKRSCSLFKVLLHVSFLFALVGVAFHFFPDALKAAIRL